MKIAVSAVAYNRPALLQRALDSLEMQENKNWSIVIVNDNSANPAVEPMAAAFAQKHNGIYVNSKVMEFERLDKCRGAVCQNIAMRFMQGDIFMHVADDMELARPDTLSIILNHFETHPESKAGYFGIGYRMANWKTGHIYSVEEMEKHLGSREKLVQWAGEDYLWRGSIMRRYSEDFGYGGKVKNVFAALDGGQFAYRKEVAFRFPEDKEHWLGEDAVTFQAMGDYIGGFDPIGDVTIPLVFGNTNEASLTTQHDPAKSIAITNDF